MSDLHHPKFALRPQACVPVPMSQRSPVGPSPLGPPRTTYLPPSQWWPTYRAPATPRSTRTYWTRSSGWQRSSQSRWWSRSVFVVDALPPPSPLTPQPCMHESFARNALGTRLGTRTNPRVALPSSLQSSAIYWHFTNVHAISMFEIEPPKTRA